MLTEHALGHSGIAYAQASDGAARQPSLVENMIPFVFMLAVMYFLFFRPQAKKAKEHSVMLAELKVGDEVITSGGIVGRIRSIAEEFVTIDTGGNSFLKIIKSNISQRAVQPAPSANKK